MRRRKPWVFFRLRLFGWNVLFTHGLLGENRSEVGDRVGAGPSGTGPGAPVTGGV